MPVALRPHQEEAIEKMHNGCILYGDVGVGKTITSLGYYFTKVCGGEINVWGSMQTPKDVYVITTAKVRDSKGFELQAAHYGIHTDPAISTNGVKVTVDSWNNLKKYVEVKNAFFIFDEQRVVGYGAWSRAFIKIARSNQWILLSATPGDTWMDYIPVFIANGWYKHKTDFLDQHVIWTPRVKYPKVLRYQNVGVLVRHRNNILVHMPYERHTVRHPIDIWCDYNQQQFDKVVKKRWHVFEERPLRDAAELFSVMRKVVNSDSSRIRALKEVLAKHPKVIVFYNFDYELEMLRELGECIQKKTKSFSIESVETGSSAENQSTCSPEGSQTTASALEKSSKASSDSSPTSSGSGSKSSSNAIELCGFKFKGQLCEDRIPCARHEGLSPGGIYENSMAEGSFAFAEWNGHKHQEIPGTDSWLYAVQYRAGAEGWNCVETDATVFFSQTYSYRDWWQAHGRIDRLNTPFVDLYYYNLVSRSPIDKAIRKALKTKKNFNERDLGLKWE